MLQRSKYLEENSEMNSVAQLTGHGILINGNGH